MAATESRVTRHASLPPLNGAVRLNIGCGDAPAATYYNVDRDMRIPEAELNVQGYPRNVHHMGGDAWVELNGYRLMEAEGHDLPVADGSVDAIYASHILEHYPVLEAPEGVATAHDALDEWFRVLKPGGRLFVAVPDGDIILRRILSEPATRDDWVLNLFGQHRPGMMHYWVYTRQSLTDMLCAHRFINIAPFEWCLTKADGEHDAAGGVAKLDDSAEVSISLNLQATKPASSETPNTEHRAPNTDG